MGHEALNSAILTASISQESASSVRSSQSMAMCLPSQESAKANNTAAVAIIVAAAAILRPRNVQLDGRDVAFSAVL